MEKGLAEILWRLLVEKGLVEIWWRLLVEEDLAFGGRGGKHL